jgi:hypothetical protein
MGRDAAPLFLERGEYETGCALFSRDAGFDEADIGVVRDNARQLKFKPDSTGFE